MLSPRSIEHRPGNQRIIIGPQIVLCTFLRDLSKFSGVQKGNVNTTILMCIDMYLFTYQFLHVFNI